MKPHSRFPVVALVLAGLLALAGCSDKADDAGGGGVSGGSTTSASPVSTGSAEAAGGAAELQSALDALKADPSSAGNDAAAELQLAVTQQQLGCAPGHEDCSVVDQFASLDGGKLTISAPAEGVCQPDQADCTGGQVLATSSADYSPSEVPYTIYWLVAGELGIEETETQWFLDAGDQSHPQAAACTGRCGWDTLSGWHVELTVPASSDEPWTDFYASFSPASAQPADAAAIRTARAALKDAAEAARDAINADAQVKDWTVTCPAGSPACAVGDFFVQTYQAQTWLVFSTEWCAGECAIETPDGPAVPDATT
ncbi:MAG: hypothetical protein LBR19_03460, partial [Bifidobacteriaceae bacterium]|nr:hypothetical protein [Bifidobacteriaceae bacterium]